jgi:hypothetical protein
MFKRTYAVHKIQKGKLLKHAEEASLKHFMHCRLQNRPRKAFVGLYLVLFEDEQFVYWGNPRFWMLFSDRRVVEKLYKTKKEEVLAAYPEYQKDFYSIEIKQRVLEEIRKYEGLKDGIQFHSVSLNQILNISTKDNLFIIIANCQISYTAAPYIQDGNEQKIATDTQQNYTIHLVRADLSLAHIE